MVSGIREAAHMPGGGGLEEAHDVHVLYMCTCMCVCAVDLPDLHSVKCFKVI